MIDNLVAASIVDRRLVLFFLRNDTLNFLKALDSRWKCYWFGVRFALNPTTALI